MHIRCPYCFFCRPQQNSVRSFLSIEPNAPRVLFFSGATRAKSQSAPLVDLHASNGMRDGRAAEKSKLHWPTHSTDSKPLTGFFALYRFCLSFDASISDYLSVPIFLSGLSSACGQTGPPIIYYVSGDRSATRSADFQIGRAAIVNWRASCAPREQTKLNPSVKSESSVVDLFSAFCEFSRLSSP